MRLRRLGIATALVCLVVFSGGCASIAQMAAGLATTKTADLEDASIQAHYITNLYDKNANTQEMSVMTSDWKDGESAVAVNLVKRYGAGFFEVDGTVTVDGEPAQYMGLGIYSKTFSKAGTAPKKVKIATTNGKVIEFNVAAPKPLKLVSINGASSGAPIDTTKDLTLNLDPGSDDSGYVRVALVAQGLGIRNFSDLGIFKLGKTVTVPAAAFKHSSLVARANLAPVQGDRKKKTMSDTIDSILVSGPNTLLVERFDIHPLKTAGVGAVESLAQAWAWMPVTVSGNAPTIPGIEVAEELPKEKSNVAYYSMKPNASTGKPLARAKKVAIVQLMLGGKLIRETENQFVAKTFQFPKVPIGHWNRVLENVHAGVTSLLKDEFGMQVIPYEKVVASPIYREFAQVNNQYSDYSISQGYKQLGYPGSSAGEKKYVMATFADDSVETRLMRDLGVDGLVFLSVEFGIQDQDTLTTHSKIGFRISGAPNGYQTSTMYADGQVVDYKGKNFNSGQFKSENSLATVIPQEDMLFAMRQALKEQEAKATQLGYDEIWAKQSAGEALALQ